MDRENIMELGKIKIKDVEVSRLIIGGNPFSGFSHQGVDKDNEMRRFYTVDRIKAELANAEKLGVNTFLGRADMHITRMLNEYRNDGGKIQWFSQSCPEMQSLDRSIDDAIENGATASYVHGGVMDFLLANDKLDEIPPAIEKIKAAGLPAGVAGHDPRVFEWAEKNLDVDFYMCSYYNAAHRDENAEHVHGRPEWFNPADRDIMVELIQTLSKPVIHYKILAAGRTAPEDAFAFNAKWLRPQDAVCVGISSEGKPDMLEEDIALFLKNNS